MPTPQPQQRAGSSSFGCSEDNNRWQETHFDNWEDELISKSIIADVTVVHNTGIKAGEMEVEIKAAEIKIDPITKKESMTPSLEILIAGVGAS